MLPGSSAPSVRPSVLRKVDRVAVGIPDAGFRLAVGRSFLDVGRGAPLLAHRNQGLNALHLETEMIDPLLELIAFDFAFGADRDDRQVDVTVGQIGGGAHSLDNLEAERIGVEFHQSIDVFRENGEMADAGHGAPPVLKSSCRAQPTAHRVTLAELEAVAKVHFRRARPCSPGQAKSSNEGRPSLPRPSLRRPSLPQPSLARPSLPQPRSSRAMAFPCATKRNLNSA